MKDLQAVLRKKKEQRTDERTRLHLKKNQLESRRRDIEDKDRELRDLKERLKAA